MDVGRSCLWSEGLLSVRARAAVLVTDGTVAEAPHGDGNRLDGSRLGRRAGGASSPAGSYQKVRLASSTAGAAHLAGSCAEHTVQVVWVFHDWPRGGFVLVELFVVGLSMGIQWVSVWTCNGHPLNIQWKSYR